MRTHFSYLVMLVAMLVVSLGATGQVRVEQKVDSIGILIGQQAHLTVTVTAPEGARVVFPSFRRAQPITPGVEVLGAAETQSTDIGNGQMQWQKAYTITSFDEHLYAIPGQKVKVNGKTYSGNTVALKVITMDVDTLHPNQFFPPKDVQDNPFMWSEWSPVFWLSLLMVLLFVTSAYLFIRLKQNKPIITHIRIVRHIPPHQKALGEIARLKAEHMTTSEDQKAYYTQLTDTLREYIKARFGFNAMEMTSSEIIYQLQQTGDKKMIDELKELFETADLVKFAKYSTLINENDLNLVNAVNFIDSTKTDAKETEERVVPKLSENDEKTRKSRITIKSLLYVTLTAVALLLIYILYKVYELLM